MKNFFFNFRVSTKVEPEQKKFKKFCGILFVEVKLKIALLRVPLKLANFLFFLKMLLVGIPIKTKLVLLMVGQTFIPL